MFRLVSVEGILLVAGFAAGLALQRHHRHAELQRWLWEAFFWTIAPAAAIYAYSTVAIDRTLVASLVIVATSSWLLLGLSILAVRFASHDDAERGALVLAAGWGNTVALGYPLANFAYGADGLRCRRSTRSSTTASRGSRSRPASPARTASTVPAAGASAPPCARAEPAGGGRRGRDRPADRGRRHHRPRALARRCRRCRVGPGRAAPARDGAAAGARSTARATSARRHSHSASAMGRRR